MSEAALAPSPPMTVALEAGSQPRIRERFGWTVAAQAASSGTNALVSFGAAHTLGSHDFGRFALAFTLTMVATGVTRAIASEPLVVSYGAHDRRWVDAVSASLSAALLAGIVSAALCLAASMVVSSDLRGLLLALGVALPGLLLQDALRMVFFAGGWPSYTFRCDVTWGAAIALPVMYLLLLDEPTAAQWLTVWAFGAAVAGFGWLLMLQPRLSITRAIAWWLAHRSLAVPFAVEFLVGTGTFQVIAIGVGAIAGLSEVGAMRGAGMILAPLQIILAGIVSAAVPHAVAMRQHDRAALDRFVMGVATGLAIVLSLGTTALAIPDVLGEKLLGATWSGAQPLLLPATVTLVLSGIAMAAAVGLRALQDARASMRAQLLSAPVLAACGALGAALDGAHGAVVALAIAQAVVTTLWWHTYRRSHRVSPRTTQVT